MSSPAANDLMVWCRARAPESLAFCSFWRFARSTPPGPGFRSRAQLDEHYQKHGAEFGAINKARIPAVGARTEGCARGRPDSRSQAPSGEFSRFDRRHGYFGAYNPDGTIRTFFIPNNGERYFQRQARRRYD